MNNSRISFNKYFKDKADSLIYNSGGKKIKGIKTTFEDQDLHDYPAFCIYYLTIGGWDKAKGKNYHLIQISFFNKLDTWTSIDVCSRMLELLGLSFTSTTRKVIVDKYDYNYTPERVTAEKMILQLKDGMGWRKIQSEPKLRHYVLDLYLYFKPD